MKQKITNMKCPFPMIKSSHSGNTIYMRLLSMKDSTKIELFYFDDNFRRIAQWVLALTLSRSAHAPRTIFLFLLLDCEKSRRRFT